MDIGKGKNSERQSRVKQLIRITSPYFCAGIERYMRLGQYDYSNAKVKIHRCAPILRYMRTWTVGRIIKYCRLKGWKYEVYG